MVCLEAGLPLESKHYIHRLLPRGLIPEYDDSGNLTYLRVDYTESSTEYIEDEWSLPNLTPGYLQGMAAALSRKNAGGQEHEDIKPGDDMDKLRIKMLKGG